MQSRAQATRDAVLLAGARVFERHGYAAATIAQILDEAGVTKGAMYFHFDSKESLASAIIAEQSDWREGTLCPAGCGFQGVIDLGYRFAGALQADPLLRASIRLTLESSTFDEAVGAKPYQELIAGVTSLLTDCEAEGELIVPVDVAAYTVVSAVTGAQLISQALCGRADLADRMREIWTVVTPGIVNEDAQERLDLAGMTACASSNLDPLDEASPDDDQGSRRPSGTGHRMSVGGPSISHSARASHDIDAATPPARCARGPACRVDNGRCTRGAA